MSGREIVNGVAQKTPREFWGLAFNPRDEGTPMHIRVPEVRGHGAFVLGSAAEMHGPNGCCTCCPPRRHVHRFVPRRCGSLYGKPRYRNRCLDCGVRQIEVAA